MRIGAAGARLTRGVHGTRQNWDIETATSKGGRVWKENERLHNISGGCLGEETKRDTQPKTGFIFMRNAASSRNTGSLRSRVSFAL